MISNTIERLEAGNERFVADKTLNRKYADQRKGLLDSKQNPYAVILSCADSRVVPEFIFDAGIGELFVVRVAGNIANKSSIASIEYAVSHLNTRVIVVLGHQNCGAVTVADEGGSHSENINHILEIIQPAIDKAGSGASINEIVKINTKLNADKLKEESKIIRDAVAKENLTIVSAYYKLEAGEVVFDK